MNLILNRFRLDSLLSEDKYLGTDLETEKKVIVYFLKDDYLINLPKIKHPNIATVLSTGDFEGKSYLIREYLSGDNFDDFVKNQPSYQELVDVLDQVVNALNISHNQGLTHGRLDSKDIFINKKEVRVADFGLRQDVGGIKGDVSQLAELYFYGLTGRHLNDLEKNSLDIDVSNINPFLKQDKRLDIDKINDLIINSLKGQVQSAGQFRELMFLTLKKKSILKPALFLLFFFLLGISIFFFLKNDSTQPVIPKTTYPLAPNLVGKTFSQASSIAKNRGISLKPIFKEGRKNRVLSQSIRPGQEVRGLLEIIVGKKSPNPTIPKLVGLDREKARQILQELGLVATYVREPSELRVGLVLKTEPKAGTKVKKDSSVLLTVAAPSGLPKVINFVGQSLEQARAAAYRRGLGVRILGYIYTNDQPANLVVKQRPAPGTRPISKVVKFFVTAPILMPDLTGQTTAQAENELKDLGLGYSILEVAGYSKGIVFKQKPLPGEVASGSAKIWVGGG